MKKFLKVLGIIVLIVAVVISAALIYFNATHPDVNPPEKITVTSSPERLAR